MPDPLHPTSNRDPGRGAVYVALCLSVLASIVALVGEVVWPVIIPPLAAAAPLLARSPRAAEWARFLSLWALIACVFLGMFSVGVLYIPAAIAMAVAALSSGQPPRQDGPPTATEDVGSHRSSAV